MSSLAQEIKTNGEFQTYLGSKEEAIYWYENDVWVIREENDQLYSVWNPTNDVLLIASDSSGRV